MVRLVLPALFLVACKTDGDLYGGGTGLALTFERPGGDTTTLRWDGATKADLREVNGGLFDSETTWDPVALVAASDTWAVRADDWFDVEAHLEAVGIDCLGLGESFTAFANDATFGFQTVLSIEGEAAYFQVVGVFGDEADVDGFAGEGRAPAQWAGDLDRCASGDLPTAVSVAWSFDEDVRVPNQCLECNLPKIDLGLDFDVNLTF